MQLVKSSGRYINMDSLVYWITERESIRFNKEVAQLPKPWSKDPVFQQTYFCNVRREDDKVTRWIRQNWKMGTLGRHLVAMAVARFVNKIPTLEVLGYPRKGFDLEYCNRFTHYMSEADTPWGNAYLVSTNGRKMPKAQYIAGVLGAIDRGARNVEYITLANTHAWLRLFDGVGSFMSGQLIADLKNTQNHPLASASDYHTWCAHGPGSLRGMAWLLGQQKCSPTQFYDEMPAVLGYINEVGWKIHAQDLQNCLCEFDKYMRVKHGTGRSKRKYNGGV